MAQLSEEMKKYLLSLKPEDISFDLYTSLFSDHSHKDEKTGKMVIEKSKINTYDTFKLKAGEYINKKDIETTAGRFFYNKLIVEKLFPAFGDYQNVTINGKMLDKLDQMISDALINDKITPDDFIYYIDCNQWLGMSFISVTCSSFTPGILNPNEKVIKLRDKLYKENEKELSKGNAALAASIEKQLLSVAKEELKDDPGMFLYSSGARGSFDNNYKNIAITKGPIFNPANGQWDIMKNNFMEGIDKADIPANANSVITGAYPKAIGQRTFGYKAKQLSSMMQDVTIDKGNTDCHTRYTLKVTITEKNKADARFRYIVENGKIVLIDDTNIGKYIGKTVNMRSPMFCKNRKSICAVCGGRLYKKLEIKNEGLTASRVASTMQNACMKTFHDASVKLHPLDPNDLSM